MEPDELEALTADVKTNGLLNPIIRCGGKILDGRNRALACFAAGVEPRFRDISEKEAGAWARSQNIFRRSLKPDQQAFALFALSQDGGDTPKGKKRLRAYQKLKKLEEDLKPLIEKAMGGEDVSEELSKLLKTKKPEIVEKNIFETLHDRLHLFEPSWSDGDEHAFIKYMEKAIATVPEGDIQKHHRDALILTLERLAKNFLKYSETLKGRG